MAKQKPYVRIQSQATIQVTCGLNNQDVTNPDAHVPDRLKISATWPKATYLIVSGTHTYPSEIVEWATVKALKDQGILTIGDFVDEAEDDVKAKSANLRLGLDEINSNKIEETFEIKKAGSLADIAGEE